MKKPVSLAPAGGSLKEPLAEPHNDAARAAELTSASQVSDAAVEPPAAAAASAMATAVWDFWSRQAEACWAHGVTLFQSTSLSQAIEAQGHFVRMQVELAREQASVWASLMNQTTGVSAIGRLPPVAIWAPWQTTLCKPGG